LYSILEKEWNAQKEKPAVKPNQIEYLEKNQGDLDIIRPLWEKLNAHHTAVSKYFKENRTAFTFEMRIKPLLGKSQEGKLRIFLARDVNTQIYIGYCVATVDCKNQGEIESIYLDQEYRSFGIGDKLMAKALGWLETMKAKKIILTVAEGNEKVFAFYRRFNFYPRLTTLWYKPDAESEGKL